MYNATSLIISLIALGFSGLSQLDNYGTRDLQVI